MLYLYQNGRDIGSYWPGEGRVTPHPADCPCRRAAGQRRRRRAQSISRYLDPSAASIESDYTKTGAAQFTLQTAVSNTMTGVLWFTRINHDLGFSDLSGTTPTNGGKFAGIKEG